MSLAEEMRRAVADAVLALEMQSSEQPSAFPAKHADVGPQPEHGHEMSQQAMLVGLQMYFEAHRPSTSRGICGNFASDEQGQAHITAGLQPPESSATPAANCWRHRATACMLGCATCTAAGGDAGPPAVEAAAAKPCGEKAIGEMPPSGSRMLRAATMHPGQREAHPSGTSQWPVTR